MSNNGKGFTLTELLVGIVVMGITLGVGAMSINSAAQTTKREAEKVAAYLQNLTRKSDRTRTKFTAEFNNDKIKATWDDGTSESLMASSGLTYKSTFSNNKMIYDSNAYTNTARIYPNGVSIFISSDITGYTSTKHYNYVTIAGKGRSSPYYVIFEKQ